MAGDWIKMRNDLHTDPRVVRISCACKAHRCAVVGALHLVWSLFDSHTSDGMLIGYTSELIEEMTDIPGLCEAMQKVGWLVIEDNCLKMPDFERHSGVSAKRRAQNASRVRISRECASRAQNVRAESAPEKRREEKRREEENKTPQPPKGGGDLQQEQVASGESEKTAKGNAKTPPLSAVASVLEARGFGGVEFANALAGFYRHRKEMGRPITMNTAAALAAKFESVGQARAIQAMRDSVANGWQGVFPEKTTGVAARPPGSTSVEEAVAEMQRRREANERRTA